MSSMTAARRRKPGCLQDVGPVERAVGWARAQPLPSDWRRIEGTNPDDVLYMHSASETSTFEHPMEDALSELRIAAKAALHLGQFRGQAELKRYVEDQIDDWRCQMKLQVGNETAGGPEISTLAKLELKIWGLNRMLEDPGTLRSPLNITHPRDEEDADLDKYHEDPMLPLCAHSLCPRRAVLVLAFLVMSAALCFWELYSPNAFLADDLKKLMKNRGPATTDAIAPHAGWRDFHAKRNQSFTIPQLRNGRLPTTRFIKGFANHSNGSAVHRNTTSSERALPRVAAGSASGPLPAGQPGK
eukprot:gnl/MRDRNA2_/MRDRNA2_61044_c0_seq1.p1 gnl/MRDRNA2_/MRDRNA2_61044_c0~~gnl/MRDRNA2_/MRDRNA2_61044_c0_seq1.p1  ORF type:complete len:300 (+),score=49.52 gnl/MRDRNA2_/MRDRNA2_61044_c0_seq1:184-1083(+)